MEPPQWAQDGDHHAGLAVVSQAVVAERAVDQAEFIIQACQKARALLVEVLDRGDAEEIGEIRSQADAMRIYATQKQLGQDAQLAAAEIVRRAERGLARVVRRGQDLGQVSTRQDGGWLARNLDRNADIIKKSPGDYLGHGRARSDMYAMVDGVSDEEFEIALAEGRREGNLSRANVARKTRRRRDDRLSYERGSRIHAGGAAGLAGDLASNRIVQVTADSLDGLVTGAGLVNVAALDEAQMPAWISSMTTSLQSLSQLVSAMQERLDASYDPSSSRGTDGPAIGSPGTGGGTLGEAEATSALIGDRDLSGIVPT